MWMCTPGGWPYFSENSTCQSVVCYKFIGLMKASSEKGIIACLFCLSLKSSEALESISRIHTGVLKSWTGCSTVFFLVGPCSIWLCFKLY